MKLELPVTKVICSEEFKEEMFSIGDMALIMDILRNKMYTNVIRTVCQEIMSNARDAHREVGKNDLPIEVKLPSQLDSNFYVKDFGPGISPSRMSDVFIRYGNSTKRDDNTQTGGFGLGAKSPFAYSDTFCIVSITPENIYKDKEGNMHENCMVRRQYVAHIDETRIGKLSMVSSNVTDEPQGTQIIIDVRNNDFSSFRLWVQKTTNYWKVRPNVVGCDNFSWKDNKAILSGDGWVLETVENSYYNYEDNHMKALVDGIPYNVNGENVNVSSSNKSYTSLRKLLESPVRIHFNTGELQLTANRENLENTDKNKKVLLKAMEEVIKDVENIIQDEMNKCENLWKALSKWKLFRESSLGSFCKEVIYKGIKIDDESSTFAMPRDKVDYFLCTRKTGYEPKVHKGGYLFFTDKTRLYIDDTDSIKPSRGRIATLLKDNPDLTEVQVIKFLTSDKKELDELNKKFYLDQLSTGVLSTVEKMKNINHKRTGVGSRGPIAKAKILTTFNEWEEFEDVDFEEDSGVYVALSYNKPIDSKTETKYDSHTLSNISKEYNVEIYGIPLRYVDKLGDDWVPFSDWAKKKFDDIKKDESLEEYGLEYEYCQNETISKTCNGIMNYLDDKDFLSNIINQDSIIHKYIDRSALVLKSQKTIHKLRVLSTIVGEEIFKNSNQNKNNFKIRELKKEFEESYPLLMQSFRYGYVNLKEEDVLFYINAVEEKKKKEVVKAEE